MQPVGRGAGQTSAHFATEAQGAPVKGSVLPKFLRKPARQMSRLLNGGFQVTGRGLAIFGGLFAIATVGTGLVVNGQAEAMMARIMPVVGFQQISYEITGAVETSQMDIMTSIAPLAAGSLLALDVSAARKALTELPWVADATVTKRYPDKVSVTLTERPPFAIWQNGDGLFMVDREGRVLGAYDGRAGVLPLMVGDGASEEAAKIMSLVARYPQIASKAKAYVRVGRRRWDIQLNNGIQLMLPETGIEGRLHKLARLADEKDILNRAVERIDLRADDRIVYRLDPDAADTLRETREEQIKRMKKAKRERKV